MNSFQALRSENLKKLIDWLIRYDAPLLAVATHELQDYLIALINALFLKASKEQELFDVATARQILPDKKRLQALLEVAEKAIGSHSLKYPNANVGQGAIFGQLSQNDQNGNHLLNSYPMMSSRTVLLTRTIGGSGNAAWAAEIRFLCMEFMLNEQRIRMADVFATRHGQVWEVLHELGFPQTDADQIGEVLQRRLTQPDQNAVDRLSKQVFFPLGNGEDIVITPVQHIGLAREFHTRFFQRISKDNKDNLTRESFNVRALKVGGANPINAGPYNAELAGLYRHLLAEMPRKTLTDDEYKIIAEAGKRLLARLRQRNTIFPHPHQLNINVTDLVRARNIPGVEGSSRHHRNLFAAAADIIAETLLQDAMDLAKWLAMQSDSPLLAAEYNNMPDLQKRWLDPRLRPNVRLGGNEMDELVDTALRLFLDSGTQRYLLAADGNISKEKPMLSDEDLRLVRDCLRERIEAC